MGMKDRVVLEGKDPTIEDFKKKTGEVCCFISFFAILIPTRSTSQRTENTEIDREGQVVRNRKWRGKGGNLCQSMG